MVNLKVFKKMYLSWVYGVDTKIRHSGSLTGITRQASMPISDPHDRFFYPYHTPMKDTYSLAHGLRQLTHDDENDARTINFRSDVIFAPP